LISHFYHLSGKNFDQKSADYLKTGCAVAPAWLIANVAAEDCNCVKGGYRYYFVAAMPGVGEMPVAGERPVFGARPDAVA